MNDRLADIKRLGGKNLQKINENDQLVYQTSQQNVIMPEFQQKVQKTQNLIEKIKQNNIQIAELKERYSKAITSTVEKEVSEQLNTIINQNNQINQQLKDVMTEIVTEVENAKNRNPDDEENQIRSNIQQALSIKVNELLQQQQNVQIDFKQGLKSKVSRQTRYLDNTLTEDQINDLCEDPTKMSELLQKKLYGKASLQLQNAVQDIQDKFKDIQKLEQSVALIYQMFLDMAILVKEQGEMLDNIELNICGAQKNIEKGEKELKKAIKDHQAIRKRQCLMIIVGLVILLVITIPVISTSV